MVKVTLEVCQPVENASDINSFQKPGVNTFNCKTCGQYSLNRAYLQATR